MISPDVVVVGGGPVGLWLAAELRIGGAEVLVLEKRIERSTHSRALTLHARTLEVFAMRGAVPPWLDEGIQIPTTHYAMLSSRLDLTALDTEYPFALFMPQVRTEELLEAHARSVGVQIVRGAAVTEVEDRGDSVLLRVAGPDQLAEVTAAFVVGCDGRRSVVRAASGIGYTGTEDALTSVLGDVILDEPDVPRAITMHTDTGSFYAVKIDAERHRLIGIEHASLKIPATTAIEFDEFRETIRHLVGTDFGMRDPSWVTRVGSATYQADEYRKGQLFLAGDAAHVHFPMGGQGLNLGVQDAMNLGWKLAAVVTGKADPSLLDSYQNERLPVGTLVIDDTLAQTGLVAMAGREGRAMREMMTAALIAHPALNAQFALAVSGLGVRYRAAETDHPLVGSRVPNLPLDDGRSVFSLLADGRFQLIGAPTDAAHRAGVLASAGADLVPDRVSVTTASLAGHGAWDGIDTALVRPDGHLLWAAG
jgi:2-polyprenyl-6-methoxyphenol hydroxylase-like FAD-dependent oxidoreductase